MFVTLSVAAMLAVSSSAQYQARADYDNCMMDSIISYLGDKTPEKDFSKAAKSMCQEQQKLFYTAVYTTEKNDGASAKEAAEIAKEEVDMMIEDSVVSYADHLAGETMPVKQVAVAEG